MRDVRVVERGEGPRLALEARQPIRIVAKASGSTLMATSRPSVRVARPVDLAHAADAQQGGDLVGPNTCAGGQ